MTERQMSHDEDKFEAGFFDIREALFTDPILSRAIAGMVERNESLASLPMTEAEAVQLNSELRAGLERYINVPTDVTGLVTYGDKRLGASPDTPETTEPCFNERLIFGGAVAIPTGEWVDEERTYYTAQLLFGRAEKNDDGTNSMQYARALPQDIMTMRSDYMSTERAHDILAIDHPEVLMKLEQRIIRTDADETEQIKNMSDMSVPVSELPDEDISVLARALDEYTAAFVELDKQLPYDIDIAGFGAKMSKNNPGSMEFGELSENGIAFAMKVKWTLIPDDTETGKVLAPYLALGFVEKEINDTIMYAELPVGGVKHIRSLRQTLVGDKTKQDPSDRS